MSTGTPCQICSSVNREYIFGCPGRGIYETLMLEISPCDPSGCLYEAMAPDELEQRKQAAAERYLEAGADLVIDSIRELPDAVAEINRRMAEQEAAC